MSGKTRECPNCGRPYHEGFLGYCGKRCAREDKGEAWVKDMERPQRKLLRFKLAAALVIAIAAVLACWI